MYDAMGRMTFMSNSVVWPPRSILLAQNWSQEQWRSHTGARVLATRGCAQIMGAECTVISIANWALKVDKGIEIELRSIAIFIFRITKSVCSPDLNVCVFGVSTTVSLRCARAGS